ncbi:peptidase, partial [archaeon]|nr:peptidase [archaeon]
PEWIKTNAGWWADGAISDGEFVSGIQHLIKDGIIEIPPTSVSAESSEEAVPEWIKTNAGWWADGAISDGEFVSGIQHLIKDGVMTINQEGNESKQKILVENETRGPELANLYSDLEKCSEISTAYKRMDCEKPINAAISLYEYKMDGDEFPIGPITYYWKGISSEGNEFSVTSSGQAILSIRMLAENTSSEIVAINCTSPQICAYDAWNGEKEFKYSGMDFTSGQIVMKPGDSREFNILFGPNIGYGGTKFEYDPSKDYFFRINEDFGSASIPLNLN